MMQCLVVGGGGGGGRGGMLTRLVLSMLGVKCHSQQWCFITQQDVGLFDDVILHLLI